MNVEKIEDWYEGLLEDIGPGENHKNLTPELESQLQGLPKELLYIWRKYGFCSYGDGLWWHTNPRDFDEIVESWLKGTSYWDPEKNPYHVVGRTSFGDLELWGEKSGNNLLIKPLLGMLFPTPSNYKQIQEYGTEGFVCGFVGGSAKESLDRNDLKGNHLFDRALKKLGPLKYNEMYTSVPMPVFSGGLTIDNVQKEDIFMQLALLRDSIDMPEIMLNPMMDYNE